MKAKPKKPAPTKRPKAVSAIDATARIEEAARRLPGDAEGAIESLALAWQATRVLVHGFAQKPGAALAKMLEARGARRYPPGYFTLGLE